jgi:hypothetical protein
MITAIVRGLSCHAVGWSNDGPRMLLDDQHAVRYEVRKYEKLIGFITTDRAWQHPDVKWKRSVLHDDNSIEDLDGNYQTVEEAFAAF